MPRALQRLLPTLLALGTLATITPARATAGTYDVYSCRTPAGFDSALSGWTGTANEVGGVLVTNTCGEGGLGSFGGAVTSGPAPESGSRRFGHLPRRLRLRLTLCGFPGTGEGETPIGPGLGRYDRT